MYVDIEPLKDVVMYDETMEFEQYQMKPAIMTESGGFADYNFDALRQAGYVLDRVVSSDGHRKGTQPLYVFREVADE